VQFVVNQTTNPIFLREAFNKTILVFPCTFEKIARNSDVKRAIPLACKDIDCWLFKHSKSLDSPKGIPHENIGQGAGPIGAFGNDERMLIAKIL
jgi:hypothetical protein